MADDLGRETIPGVAHASRCPHPTRLLTPICSRKRGVVAWIGEWVAIPPTQCELCDTDGERATQLQHAVHDMHRDGDLGGATLVVSKAQSITDYLLADRLIQVG